MFKSGKGLEINFFFFNLRSLAVDAYLIEIETVTR